MPPASAISPPTPATRSTTARRSGARHRATAAHTTTTTATLQTAHHLLPKANPSASPASSSSDVRYSRSCRARNTSPAPIIASAGTSALAPSKAEIWNTGSATTVAAISAAPERVARSSRASA